jgi:hypothetical protein
LKQQVSFITIQLFYYDPLVWGVAGSVSPDKDPLSNRPAFSGENPPEWRLRFADGASAISLPSRASGSITKAVL